MPIKIHDTVFAKRVPPQSGAGRQPFVVFTTSMFTYEKRWMGDGTLRATRTMFGLWFQDLWRRWPIRLQAMYYEDGSYAGINENRSSTSNHGWTGTCKQPANVEFAEAIHLLLLVDTVVQMQLLVADAGDCWDGGHRVEGHWCKRSNYM